METTTYYPEGVAFKDMDANLLETCGLWVQLDGEPDVVKDHTWHETMRELDRDLTPQPQPEPEPETRNLACVGLDDGDSDFVAVCVKPSCRVDVLTTGRKVQETGGEIYCTAHQPDPVEACYKTCLTCLTRSECERSPHDAYWCGLNSCPDEDSCPYLVLA